jgi:hypothetical protein
MALIIRHGGEAHVMRPDGVYRTGVLQPMVGYHPGADVRAVGRMFTARGLEGLGGLNVFERMKLRIQGWFSGAKAAAFTNVAPGTQVSMDAAYDSAKTISPQLAMSSSNAFQIISGNANGLQQNAITRHATAVIARRRFNTYYNAG